MLLNSGVSGGHEGTIYSPDLKKENNLICGVIRSRKKGDLPKGGLQHCKLLLTSKCRRWISLAVGAQYNRDGRERGKKDSDFHF